MTDRQDSARRGADWVVLLPVKDLVHAKSRLLVPDRAALALAMLRDAVTAGRQSVGVKEVWLVTNDPAVSAAFPPEPDSAGLPPAAGPQLAPVRVVPDWPAAGLNAAVTYAAGLVEATSPVAVLAGDLPALRPAELAMALAAAAAHDRAVVADAPGTGTVLLTSLHPAALQPAFGTGSRVLHVASGAFDLTAGLTGRIPGLQQDVDTTEDLAAAITLGPGPATQAVLAPESEPTEHLCAPFGTIEP